MDQLPIPQLVDIILSSSSDDEDESEDLLKYYLQRGLQTEKTKPKVINFMGNVIEQYNDADFKKNLRVGKTVFTHLVENFENSELYTKCDSHGGSVVKSPKVHIAAFLWFAGNKIPLRFAATLFDTSVSTMFSIIKRVVKYILSLGPQVIKFPASQEDKEVISTKFFAISNFPNVLGCIDGTYIHLRTPALKVKSTYVNRHDITSLTLQGICDSERKFLDVFTGVSGKVHDARTYNMSFIKNVVNNLEQKYHIIGDAAYPISPNLLTPFRDYGQLTPIETQFNKRFSQTRVKIENSFGLLKTRFRQLIELDFWKVEKASEFIISCCILHNLCIDKEDFLETITEENALLDDNPPMYNNERERLLKTLGEMKRNQLAQDFFNN